MDTRRARPLDAHGGFELIERASAWWRRWQRIALGVAIGAIVVGGGTFFHLRTRAAQEEQASARLAEASLFFWQEDYPRSLELAKQVYTQYGSTRSGHEAHRLAGDNAFWNGDFKSAVAEYRRYLDKVKTGLLADAARRSLAYALESDGQPLEAARIYDQLGGKLDRVSSAEFLVAAARSYRNAGQNAEAIRRLQRVDQEFGDTYYAHSARVQLGELEAAAAR